MLIVFPFKLSFDSGHVSLRQGLKGRVNMKVAYVHKRLGFMCAYREINPAHKENQNWCVNAKMVACTLVLCDQYVGARSCF
jgi:hypothetical protein